MMQRNDSRKIEERFVAAIEDIASELGALHRAITANGEAYRDLIEDVIRITGERNVTLSDAITTAGSYVGEGLEKVAQSLDDIALLPEEGEAN